MAEKDCQGVQIFRRTGLFRSASGYPEPLLKPVSGPAVIAFFQGNQSQLQITGHQVPPGLRPACPADQGRGLHQTFFKQTAGGGIKACRDFKFTVVLGQRDDGIVSIFGVGGSGIFSVSQTVPEFCGLKKVFGVAAGKAAKLKQVGGQGATGLDEAGLFCDGPVYLRALFQPTAGSGKVIFLPDAST